MSAVVSIKNLNYSYPDGQAALNDISLQIYPGETVALIGPNGAGKSTLLLHLNGILRTNGAVRVFESEITDKTIKQVRSKVGLVFQNPDDQLFSPTVFDDVAFGPINMGFSEKEVREKVRNALDAVGMSGFEKRSPHHLSIGEKKRIAIATVLSMDPALLALDEPTSSLDPRGKWSLVSLLRKLTQTKLIATHDLELVKAICTRVIILEKGKIMADGRAAEILSDITLLNQHGLLPPDLNQI